MPPGAETTARAPDVAGVPPRFRLAVLFLTVFVDLVGFGIVLPLLPLYADRFGATGTQIGILVLSYSAAQLLLAPVWGRLSDRIGRRPVLIVGLLGSAVSYVIFAYAGSIPVLLLSRIMAGVGGANIPVAQAYVADVTPPENRAGSMGLIGAAFGLGFIFGPAIAGVLAPMAPELPGLAAAGLCAGNAFLAVLFLPESLSRDERTAREERKASENQKGIGELRLLLAAPAFRRVLVVSLLFQVAFSAIHPTFSLFAAQRFHLSEAAVGSLFAFLGVMSAVMQGGLVPVFAARFGEVALIRACAIPFVAGFILIAISPSVALLLVGLALLALGFGGTLPSLTSLLSRSAPEVLLGGSLGVGQSVGALGRILGPLLAGVTWDVLGVQWPYFIAAGIGVAAGAWSGTLRQPGPVLRAAPVVEAEAPLDASPS
ncbi:MAG: MFS transporter [Gemmatimonadetes bacterium]|nr:MFS transporter [Gemmatimonadota bacterium]